MHTREYKPDQSFRGSIDPMDEIEDFKTYVAEYFSWEAPRHGDDATGRQCHMFIAFSGRALAGEMQDERRLADPALADQQKASAGDPAACGVQKYRVWRQSGIGLREAVHMKKIQR